jgi:hypothetical protein
LRTDTSYKKIGCHSAYKQLYNKKSVGQFAVSFTRNQLNANGLIVKYTEKPKTYSGDMVTTIALFLLQQEMEVTLPNSLLIEDDYLFYSSYFEER